MPTENWYPISSATHDLPAGRDTWVNGGGANKNASATVGGGRAGPATHDDDTTYIEKGGATGHQALNVDWPGPMATYDGVLTVNGRHRSSGGGSVQRQGYISSADGTIATAWLDITNNNAAYVSTGPVDISNAATYRPGGGSWSQADFVSDAVMFADVYNADTGNTARFTSIWGTISYTPATGGFAFILQLTGLGALPFVGHMTDIAQFRSYLSWRRRYHPRHTIMTGDEVRRAWRELREYKHPTFFIPRFA